MNVYVEGTEIKISVKFYRDAATPIAEDPTDVAISVKPVGGTQTDYLYSLGEITRDAVGEYSLTINPATTGKHEYVVRGKGPAGTVNITDKRNFMVRSTSLTDPL